MSEYAERDIVEQGEYYSRHTSAMTGEDLNSKSDIAAELAHRDIEIDRLKSRSAALGKSCVILASENIAKVFNEPPLKAWLLRKQAEAVHALILKIGLQCDGNPQEIVEEEFERLRGEAEKISTSGKIGGSEYPIHEKCGGKMAGPLRHGSIVTCLSCGATAEALVDDGGTDLVFDINAENAEGGS
ncbi:MAG: hypothetical protein ACI92B_001490 [Marinobacter maritimus]|jgi:hypothetical protein